MKIILVAGISLLSLAACSKPAEAPAEAPQAGSETQSPTAQTDAPSETPAVPVDPVAKAEDKDDLAKKAEADEVAAKAKAEADEKTKAEAAKKAEEQKKKAEADAKIKADAEKANAVTVAQAGPPASWSKCVTCHVAVKGGANKVGPNLFGVYGTKAGQGSFAFSEALKNSGVTWTDANLDQWLTKPSALVPGSKMYFPGVADAAQRKEIIAYLKAQR